MDSSLLLGLLIGLIVGLVVGAIVMLMFQRKQGGNQTLHELQQEHDIFREQVADHFVETANLVNHLTDSYKEVFDHLQSGAQSLVDEKTLRDKLPRMDEEAVVLKRLGSQPRHDRPVGYDSDDDEK